jgi:hypothetical protein
MPDRSNGRGQTKCSAWSSRFGAGLGDNPIPEKSTVTKPADPMKGRHGGGQDTHGIAGSVKKKKKGEMKMYCNSFIVIVFRILDTRHRTGCFGGKDPNFYSDGVVF